MKTYTLYNTYAKYADALKSALIDQTLSIVDFGTAMANKRRTKISKRK